MLFAPENWWIGDYTSARNKTPSPYFIEALEDSDVLLSDYDSNEKMMKSFPKIMENYQAGLQKHAAAKDKRIVSSLTATAEERYEDFLKRYPSIALRVPQHMLASYLGITPETLSRIRKNRSAKK